MLEILITWFILAAAFWITAALLPGMRIEGAGGALLASAIFGVLNLVVGWFLFGVIGVATLGVGFLLAFITRFIVDAILLKVTDLMTRRLTISGLGTVLAAAFLVAALGTLGHWLVDAVA